GGKTASQTAPVSSNSPQTKESSPVGQTIVVRGLPSAQAAPKGEASDQSGKPSVAGKTASQTAPVSSNSPQTKESSPVGQTIVVRGLPSAPVLRQTTKGDSLPHQTKGADASGSVSADETLPKGRQGDMFTGPDPKPVQEQKATPQRSADTSADAAGDSGKKPVAQPTALLLLPDEAIAGKPSGAPPAAAAENPKAPQDPTLEANQNTPAGKATATHAAHEQQAPSGTVLPGVTQCAPAPASVLPVPSAPQPANSGNQKAIVQPTAPSGVANLSTASAVPATASAAPATASAAPAAGLAPMPGEHLAFALSATAANGAAAPSARQTAPQAGSQPLAVSDAGTPKTADRVPAIPAPAASVLQQAVPQQAFAIGAGAWQPVASFTGPAHQAPPAAPPQAATPELHQPDQPASQEPLRILRVQFTGDNNQKVDVRMGDTGGALRVSVRSTDAGLTQTLQTNLPELTAQLGSQRFHTEIWLPQSANPGTGNAGTGNTGTGAGRPGGFSFSGGHPNGQGQAGGGQQHRQNHYQPEWIDDFQAHPRRTQMTRRS
ncbi:MAG TPA: hypothetical protein VF283_14490, partial [Bryobacteraceae bacterium]